MRLLMQMFLRHHPALSDLGSPLQVARLSIPSIGNSSTKTYTNLMTPETGFGGFRAQDKTNRKSRLRGSSDSESSDERMVCP